MKRLVTISFLVSLGLNAFAQAGDDVPAGLKPILTCKPPLTLKRTMRDSLEEGHKSFMEECVNRDENGDLISTGPYLSRWDNGEIRQRGQYDQLGRKDRLIITYYPNGRKFAEAETKAGKDNGKVVLYDREGSPSSEEYYKDGVRISGLSDPSLVVLSPVAKQCSDAHACIEFELKNQSNGLLDFISLTCSIFNRKGELIARESTNTTNLAAGQSKTVKVIISNVNADAIERWEPKLTRVSVVQKSDTFDATNEFALNSSASLKKAEKQAKVLEAPRSAVEEAKETSTRSVASKCNVDAVKISFLKSCTYAGQIQADSSGGRGDANKIDTVCRCIAKGFNVEALDSLLQGECEYSIPAARAVVGMDKVRLQCGAF